MLQGDTRRDWCEKFRINPHSINCRHCGHPWRRRDAHIKSNIIILFSSLVCLTPKLLHQKMAGAGIRSRSAYIRKISLDGYSEMSVFSYIDTEV